MSSEFAALWRGEAAVEPSGREAELSLLLREYDGAKETARPRFVFVRGPQGVGKSHLFGLVRESLSRRGVSVFEGLSGRDARRSFGLFQPIVAELVTHLEQSGVPQPRLHEVMQAVRPLSRPAQGESFDRLQLFDGVVELLSMAGRDVPVFLLPDVEVADPASQELLRYVAAVMSTPQAKGGGLFVLSLRDDAKLPAAVAELTSRLSARTLNLGGLDLEGIRALLSRRDVAQQLLEATGGNPDALGELLSRPVAPVDFFIKRLERLTSDEKKVLETLSVASQPLSLEVLEQALPGVAVPAVLDALVAARLLSLKVVDGSPRYRFARAAEQTALAQTLGPKKSQLTALVVKALEVCGEMLAAAELGWSVEGAEAAARALSAANAVIARGAWEEAQVWLERALLLTKGADRCDVQARLAQVHEVLGNYRGAARAFAQSARVRDEAVAAQRTLSSARHLQKLGRFKLAEALARRAATKLPAPGAVEPLLAELEVSQGRAAEALARCRRVLASESVGAKVAVELANVMGKAHLVLGQFAEAAQVFSSNAVAAEAAGANDLASIARHNEGVAAHNLGDKERAIGCYQSASSAHRPAHAQALANLGSLYAEAGDFEAAVEHLTRALQAFSRFGGSREVAMAASNLARLHQFLGERERATELSEHALKLAADRGDVYLQASAQLNLGAVALDARDYLEAQRLLDSARAKFETVGHDGYGALSAAHKARAHLLAGEKTQSTAELARRVVEKGTQAWPVAALEVELVRGEVALALGDLHGVARSVARAKDTLLARPELEGPYRVHFLAGRMKAAGGDAAGAQTELARAARALDELSQRVPPVRRQAFLSVPRRSEVLAVAEPELKLPRPMAPRFSESKLHGLIGKSGALARITRQLEPIGRSNATALIRGESGTGKELLAEALHQLSPRRSMPLVKVNCAAMVEDLLLSELFGHEKGAFTGAIRERKGRFELADGGTLFLDEIGDISPKCQVALLRVLQEREFERVGGTRTLKVDVRVICATNRDLEALIAQGRFRADLYYRLKGVMLELPALRERLEDLPVLAQHFLARAAAERHEVPKQLAPESLELLKRHTWPGNVRELENVLSAAAIFAEGNVVGPDAFAHVHELRALMEASPELVPSPLEAPEEMPVATQVRLATPVATAPVVRSNGPLDYYELAKQRGMGLRDLQHEMEMQCIKRALLEARGNISEAARLLQMKRSRLSQIVNAEGELREVAHGDE